MYLSFPCTCYLPNDNPPCTKFLRHRSQTNCTDILSRMLPNDCRMTQSPNWKGCWGRNHLKIIYENADPDYVFLVTKLSPWAWESPEIIKMPSTKMNSHISSFIYFMSTSRYVLALFCEETLTCDVQLLRPKDVSVSEVKPLKESMQNIDSR